MIDNITLEDNINKNKFENNYIMFGFNENLMKESIKDIKKKNLDENFADLSFVQFDGYTTDAETIINACETFPFMGEKKIVVVYRSIFLEDNSKQQGVNAETTYKALSAYIPKIPDHTILIMYYVFTDKREKISRRVLSLKNKANLVEFKILKGEILTKKVKNIFTRKNAEIGGVELNLFCSLVDNNMDIIECEVEKLISYTMGRKINKEDILDLAQPKSDNDIFNLVDFISQKNTKKALDILNELLFRGEKFPYIITMIIRQFKILLNIKALMSSNVKNQDIHKELRLNPYIAEKMISQSKKYSTEQLIKSLDLCIKCEKTLKSTSVDVKIQLETLLIKIAWA